MRSLRRVLVIALVVLTSLLAALLGSAVAGADCTSSGFSTGVSPGVPAVHYGPYTANATSGTTLSMNVTAATGDLMVFLVTGSTAVSTVTDTAGDSFYLTAGPSGCTGYNDSFFSGVSRSGLVAAAGNVTVSYVGTNSAAIGHEVSFSGAGWLGKDVSGGAACQTASSAQPGSGTMTPVVAGGLYVAGAVTATSVTGSPGGWGSVTVAGPVGTLYQGMAWTVGGGPVVATWKLASASVMYSLPMVVFAPNTGIAGGVLSQPACQVVTPEGMSDTDLALLVGALVLTLGALFVRAIVGAS